MPAGRLHHWNLPAGCQTAWPRDYVRPEVLHILSVSRRFHSRSIGFSFSEWGTPRHTWEEERGCISDDLLFSWQLSFIHPSILQCSHSFSCLSIPPPIDSSIHRFLHLAIHLSIYPSTGVCSQMLSQNIYFVFYDCVYTYMKIKIKYIYTYHIYNLNRFQLVNGS